MPESLRHQCGFAGCHGCRGVADRVSLTCARACVCGVLPASVTHMGAIHGREDEILHGVNSFIAHVQAASVLQQLVARCSRERDRNFLY